MTPLQPGDKAPLFSGIDQDGNKVSLSSFKGQKLILYCYPKDLTATCTVQACNLRDHYKLLIKKGYAVVGVSPDDQALHRKFREKMPYPLHCWPIPNKKY